MEGVAKPARRTPPPLRGSSPCEAGQFCHPHGKQKGRYAPADSIKSPLIFRYIQKTECHEIPVKIDKLCRFR